MYSSVVSGVTGGGSASPSRELLRALEDQARELHVVLSRLTEARLLMPTTTDNSWRGLAQLFYCLELLRLRADLDAAQGQVTSAIQETQRAAESLGYRVG